MTRIVPKGAALFDSHKLRLEYGDGKIVVCHISKDNSMLFFKAYEDVFELSELAEYGFSKEICGRNILEHKIETTEYASFLSKSKPALREIVFVLKDGRKIVFEGANFARGQLCGLVKYIEENIGIRPTGMLGVSLLTTKFTDDKLDYIFDMILFSEKKLQNVELETSDMYFTNEAVVIYNSGQVAHIPYDKLQAVCFCEQTGNARGVSMNGYSCCFWLKNGERYYKIVKSDKDFVKIAMYIRRNHPEIEVDSELIYEGIFF